MSLNRYRFRYFTSGSHIIFRNWVNISPDLSDEKKIVKCLTDSQRSADDVVFIEILDEGEVS